MKWEKAAIALSLALAGTSIWACSSDSSAPASVCSKDDLQTPVNESECRELATVAAGLEAVGKRKCTKCHGDDMSGQTVALPDVTMTPAGEAVELYPPNLTSDVTGVATPAQGGKWTDDQLALAIRSGVDQNGQSLCPQMKHFSEMSDFEAYSIVMYLRSLAPVSKKVPRSVCPPTKTKEQQNL